MDRAPHGPRSDPLERSPVRSDGADVRCTGAMMSWNRTSSATSLRRWLRSAALRACAACPGPAGLGGQGAVSAASAGAAARTARRHAHHVQADTTHWKLSLALERRFCLRSGMTTTVEQ